MSWRLAKSLKTLRKQVNVIAPKRSKASDGTIGDAAHASRSSDHNPRVKDGATDVVTALDITHDPANGVDIQKLANTLVASKDKRIKYIICNGKIVSGTGANHPAWKWREYNGSNRHNKHVHISVKSSKSAYDSIVAWKLTGEAIAEVSPDDSILKKGSKGAFVVELQINLNKLGYGPLKTDGDFGAATEKAVKAFQTKVGLASDGWAGPRTIKAIGKALEEKANKPKMKEAEATVPDTASEAVHDETSWWQKITGAGGVGGLGLGAVFGMEWQTLAVLAGSVVVLMLLILIFRRRLIAVYKEINTEVKK